MSPEERQLLQGLFDRMRGQANGPRDRDAEQMIGDAVRQQPYAPYLLAQTVIVQDQALQAANSRLQQLEQQVADLQRNAPQQGGGSGGFLSGLFGGGQRPSDPPVQRPVWNQGQAAQPYAPPPQQGGWGNQAQATNMGGGMMGGGMMGGGGGGGGFLKGALGAAAGVAGGVLLADSIKGLIGGHGSPLGIGAGVPGAGETVINNYYEDNGGPGGDMGGSTDAGWDPGPGSGGDLGGATEASWDPGDTGGDVGGGDDGSWDV